MKFRLVAVLLLSGMIGVAHAQSQAEDQYIGICNQLVQAGTLAENGETGEALAAYTDVQNRLQHFQKVYPDWNATVVAFRLNQVAGKIAEIKSHLPPPVAAILKTNLPVAAPKVESPAPTPAPALIVTPAPAVKSEPPQFIADMDALRAQLRAEVAANEKLQTKLKEALATRPAATDPAELAKAQEKVRALMKQNDLLLASRGAGTSTVMETRVITNVVFRTNVLTSVVLRTNFTKVYITNGPVEVTNLAAAFPQSNRQVVVTNYVNITNVVRTELVDSNALRMARLDYTAAVKNFNAEHVRAEQLADELERLRRVGATPATNFSAPSVKIVATNDATTLAALAALQAENAGLKKELDRLRTVSATNEARLTTELKQARSQIATLLSEAQVAALEKVALQRKLETLMAATNSSTSTAAYEARIRELTGERNDLISRLDTATKQKPGANSDALAKLAALNQEVAGLRARLTVAESKPVPFTAEELALLKSSPATLSASDSSKKSIKEMPAGTVELIHSAQQHFEHGEFSQAEADYENILNRDQNNAIALANLAAIELQENKLAEAEQHINAALKQSPDDPYNLATCGQLKVMQEKYEEALSYLSRAVQAEPNNPNTQNFLGLAYGHLGQRKQAENALRRAIQIAPDFAAAHNNLAVVYITQDPPSPSLARWHYQKAIENGQPRNPDLEKLLAEKGAPVQ